VTVTDWRKNLRERVYEVLEVGRGEDTVSYVVDVCIVVLIVLNILAFTLETVPAISSRYGTQLFAFELFSVMVFTIEYVLRLWSCVEVPFLKRLSPWQARLRFARRPYLLIDLLAILPFYFTLIFPLDLRILRVLRLFRFLKLARYSPAMHALLQVLVNERRALLGALLLMIAMLLFSATGIYFIERYEQPEQFGSIPDAAWWAMATLTTVGYGDVSPVTASGKAFGSVVMVLGLGMFALPIAIIATGFSQEVGRRDFVVTWSMMSRIPLLAELEAKDISELMPYVRATNFPQHWQVISPGDEATSMYFIASGEIHVHTTGGDAVLQTGDFFGEIAMLEQSRYEFAFTTESRVRLLEIQRSDYQRLEMRHPSIGEHIRTIAEARKQARLEGRPEPRGHTE